MLKKLTVKVGCLNPLDGLVFNSSSVDVVVGALAHGWGDLVDQSIYGCVDPLLGAALFFGPLSS